MLYLWSELEKQFNELAPHFRDSRLDIQWGDSGEYFRIAGGADRIAIQRFEVLARKSGELLLKLDSLKEHEEIVQEKDPLNRWYKALWKLTNNMEFRFYGNMFNEKEEVIGVVYSGTINRFVEASALLCLEFATDDEATVASSSVSHQERSPLKLDNLHPNIINTSGRLYEDGHYRSAVLDAYIDLINRVKRLSGRPDLDGSRLMQQVFSAKNPTMLVSDDPDEQLGFMWLFSGAVMAIRNPKAHKIVEVTDPQRSLEWLAFASVLHRILDDIENVS